MIGGKHPLTILTGKHASKFQFICDVGAMVYVYCITQELAFAGQSHAMEVAIKNMAQVV